MANWKPKPLDKKSLRLFLRENFTRNYYKRRVQKNDMLDGEIRLYEEGKLINIFHYKEDVPDGEYMAFYYPDEKLYITGFFKAGKKDSTWKIFNKKGILESIKKYKEDEEY